MKRNNLDYISGYLDNKNINNRDTVITLSTFEDLVYYSTEDFGSIISQIFKGLITLIQALLDFFVKVITKLYQQINKYLSVYMSNIREIKKKSKIPGYDDVVSNTQISEGIDYSVCVEILYAYVKVYQLVSRLFNTTDLIEQFNLISNLEPNDPGLYLKPTKYILTDDTFQSIEQDLYKIGFDVNLTDSVQINNQIVWLKADIQYTSQYLAYKKINMTLSELGYTTKNIITMSDNSFNTFYNESSNGDIYFKSLQKIRDKLYNLHQKSSRFKDLPNLDDPNNKVRRCQYLLCNISILVNLYSKLLSSSQEYISYFTNLTTIFKNIV